MVSSGTLSSTATSSVLTERPEAAPADSPDSGTSIGATSVGGQSDLGQDHNVAIAPSSTHKSLRPTPASDGVTIPAPSPVHRMSESVHAGDSVISNPPPRDI